MADAVPRLRIFAGPNGSGKSTLLLDLRGRFSLGIYVNADEIEHTLRERGFLHLDDFKLTVNQQQLLDFFATGSTALSKSFAGEIPLRIERNVLVLQPSTSTNSYLAAGVADFLRHQLLLAKQSFTFETVMSHPSKLELLRLATQYGYRTYLYFIATETPAVNIGRVQNRVSKGGHAVPVDKIVDRYQKTLHLLPEAIRLVNRAYLFDNSGEAIWWFAEVASQQLTLSGSSVPEWFRRIWSDNLDLAASG